MNTQESKENAKQIMITYFQLLQEAFWKCLFVLFQFYQLKILKKADVLVMRLPKFTIYLFQIGRQPNLVYSSINSQYWGLQSLVQSKKSMKKTLNRSWQPQDNLLQFLVENSLKNRIPWLQLSKQLSLKTGRQRSGKQCRERWLHQLNPRITRQKWGNDETNKLFQLHRKLGNRWSAIAEQLSGRTDNIVKNYFYSMIRKTITKINGILAQKRQIAELRQMRTFGSDLASKLILVSDGHYQLRVRLNSFVLEESAKDILYQIIDIHEEIDSNDVTQDRIISLLVKMHEFRSNSKKRKRCRKSKESMRFCQQANSQHIQPFQSNNSSLSNVFSQVKPQKQPYAICQDQLYSQHLQYSSQQVFTQNKVNQIIQNANIFQCQPKCISTEPESPQQFSQHRISQQSFKSKKLNEHKKGEPFLSIPIISDLQQRREQQFTCIFTPICQDDWQFPQQAQGLASPFCQYASFLGIEDRELVLRPISDTLLP